MGRLNRTIPLAVLAILLAAGCGDRPRAQERPIASMFQNEGTLTFEKADGTKLATIAIEIADDQQQRESGLMGRPTLGENNGMLFVFEQEQPLAFWMMNTMISLDMVFVNAQKEIVTIHTNTTPFSAESYPAAKEGMYVVEVNAGFCQRYGIEVGDRIRFEKK